MSIRTFDLRLQRRFAVAALFLAMAAISLANNLITTEKARSAGPGHPWQGGPDDVNLYSLAKQTSLRLIGWNARGGLPVGLSLHHNSQANTSNPALGKKWQHSYDTHLQVWTQSGVKRAALVWGDHTVQMFQESQGSWVPDDGYRSVLAAEGTGYSVTLKSQVVLHFQAFPQVGNTMLVPRRYRLASMVDPSGNQIQYQYDGQSRLIRVDDPSGRSLFFSYSQSKLSAVDFVAPGGTVSSWNFIYDGLGRLIHVGLPPVTTDSGLQAYAVRYEYDANGNVRKVIDCEGYTSLYGYNGDRINFAQWPGNSSAECATYDASGNLRVVTDPMGNVTHYEYDGLSRLIRHQDASFFDVYYEYSDADYAYGMSRLLKPSGLEVRSDYDAKGNVVSVKDPAGEVWDFTYDARNNLVRTLEPLVTDAYGNVESGRHRTDYVYDANDRLVERKRYTTPSTFLSDLYSYDAFGQLTGLTNPMNRTWTYQYDAFGNMVRATTPMGLDVRSFFDTSVQTTGFTVPNAWSDATGLRTELNRDEWGRLRQADYLNEPDRRYSYDGLNRLVRTIDATGTTDYTYGLRGLLTTVIKGGWTCLYGHNANLLRTSLMEDSGTGVHLISYAYDQRNQLQSLTDGGSPSFFTYDPDGRLINKQLGNGATSTYSYAGGRLAGVSHFDALNNQLSNRTYSYQDDGRLKRADEAGPFTRYQYDFLGRLVREERSGGSNYNHLYQFDPAGNRVFHSRSGSQTTYQYDADNRLIVALPQGMAPEQYQYDPSGRLMQRTRNNNAEVFQFGYDTDGRLTQLRQWNGQGFLPAATFSYDALGRRVTRDAFNSLGQSTAHVASFFDSYYEVRLDGIYNGAPRTELASYLRTGEILNIPGDDGLFRVKDITSNREYWSATDGRGDLRQYTTAQGNNGGFSATYDAFGNTMAMQGTPTRYQWNADRGAGTDGDAGLICMPVPGWIEPICPMPMNFHDPKTGNNLASGPNLYGDEPLIWCNWLDAWERVKQRMKEREDFEKVMEANFGPTVPLPEPPHVIDDEPFGNNGSPTPIGNVIQILGDECKEGGALWRFNKWLGVWDNLKAIFGEEGRR